jgi:nucleoside phosphorylase/beta-lactamase superfamily II metal-dependent hydrolase
VRFESTAQELTCLASAAGFVDARLLRHLRREFVEDGDAADEAAVWWSALVETRGVNGITFRPDALDALRLDLSNHPRRNDVIEAVRKFHAGGPALLMLEEEIVGLAVSKQSTTKIDQRLAVAVRALDDKARADEVCDWAARALARLPLEARSTPSWFLLAMAVSARETELGLDDTTSPGVSAEQWRRLLPKANLELALHVAEGGVLIASRASNALASIRSEIGRFLDGEGLVVGSGFIVERDLALTAAHVVRGADKRVFQYGERTFEANTLYVNDTLDYALVRVSVSGELLRLVRTTPLEGARCATYANANLGQRPAVTAGIVRQLDPLVISFDLVESTAVLSGAPVVTIDGVIGIVTRMIRRSGAPFTKDDPPYGILIDGVDAERTEFGCVSAAAMLDDDARRSIALVSYANLPILRVPASTPPIIVVQEGESQRNVSMSDRDTIELGAAAGIIGVGNWRGEMWTTHLEPARQHPASLEHPSPFDIPYFCDVAFVFAAFEEYAAFRRRLELDGRVVDAKATSSALMRFERAVAGQAPYQCVACFTPSPGPMPAAQIVDELVRLFFPRTIVSCGLGASIGRDVFIGDVVVASSVLSIDQGSMYQLDSRLQSAISNLLGDPNPIAKLFSEASSDRRSSGIQDPSVRDGSKIHLGQLASSDAVVQRLSREELLNRSRDLLAVEMEASAVIQVATRLGVPALVVRGISDYVDDEERESARELVARNTARFLIEIMRNGLFPRASESSSPEQETREQLHQGTASGRATQRSSGDSRVFSAPQPGPTTHALVIGVGRYPHMSGGTTPSAAARIGLGQLSSPPVSAHAFARWLIDEFHNEERPLASLRLLVSSNKDLAFAGQHGAVTLMRATIDAIEKASAEWFAEGDANAENQLIFYFCGYGFETAAGRSLLVEDFGDPSSPDLSQGAIDFKRFHEGLNRCSARYQCFFVDAIRKEAAFPIQNPGRSFFYPSLLGERKMQPLLYAERTGVPGAETNEPTAFTEALLRGLRGTGASATSGGKWSVTVPRLFEAISTHMTSEDKVRPAAEDLVDFPILTLRKPPTVRVLVRCSPPELFTPVRLLCRDEQQAVVHDGLMTAEQVALDLPAGLYEFAATTVVPPRSTVQLVGVLPPEHRVTMIFDDLKSEVPRKPLLDALDDSRRLARSDEVSSRATIVGLEVTFLPAGQGDAIWIRWPDGGRTRQMMIDMGEQSSGRQLRRRFERLSEEEREFELLALTHGDADRIGGVRSCLIDDPVPGLTFNDVWFNGLQHLQPRSVAGRFGGAKRSGGMRGRLLDWLSGQRWNRAFQGNAVRVEPRGRLPRIELAGGAVITILGPTVERLELLAPSWQKEAERIPWRDVPDDEASEPDDSEIDQEDEEDDELETPTPRKRRSKAPELANRNDLLSLAAGAMNRDAQPRNGSSICFLFEFNGRRILFASDAFAGDLTKGLARVNDGKKVKLDAFKVSHGGSRNNTTRQLIEAVDCSRYWFSTDGRHFGHPSPEAVACILAYADRSVELGFNYRSEFTAWWDSASWKKRFKYETVYGDNGVLVTSFASSRRRGIPEP